MVLLHGYSDSLRSFDLLMPHLPGSVRAIAVTQRGHGDADRPAGGYGPEVHAAGPRAHGRARHRGGRDRRALGGRLHRPGRRRRPPRPYPRGRARRRAPCLRRQPGGGGARRGGAPAHRPGRPRLRAGLPGELPGRAGAGGVPRGRHRRGRKARLEELSRRPPLGRRPHGGRHHRGADADPVGRQGRVHHPRRPGGAARRHPRRGARRLRGHRPLPHWERPERAAADLASFAAHVESAEPVPSVP